MPRRHVLAPFAAFALSGSFFATAGCESSSETSTPPPASPYQAQGPYGAPGTYGPQYGSPAPQPYGATPQYGAPPPQYGPPPYQQAPQYGPPTPQYGPPQNAPSAAPPALPTGPDPLRTSNTQWLRNRGAALMAELIAVLPDAQRQRVQGLPLSIDDTPGLVNAFATCTGNKAALVVSDALLGIIAHLSRARADDDVFGTQETPAYIAFVAKNARPNVPVPEPSGLFDDRHESDPRVTTRRFDVYDETVAFVIGHELGHHHLGHLPCTGGPGFLGVGDIARGLSGSIPIFNQPNEIEADAAGTNNVLVAGARRNGYHWTEAGALLVMQFFTGIDQMSPIDILFSFENTHPPPQVRIPVIQQTANLVRMSGGAWLPLPRS